MVPPITKEEHQKMVKKHPSAIDYVINMFYEKTSSKLGVNEVKMAVHTWLRFQKMPLGMFPSFVGGCQQILNYFNQKFA